MKFQLVPARGFGSSTDKRGCRVDVLLEGTASCRGGAASRRACLRGPAALLMALLAVAVLGAAPGVARAARPVVAAFSVTPRVLPSTGGTVTITGQVRGAVSCTIYSNDGRPVTVGCASGHFRVRLWFSANSGRSSGFYPMHVEVRNGREVALSHNEGVQVLLAESHFAASAASPAATPPPPPVVS